MRFVPTKTRDQQAILMLHRTRTLLVRQRTATINAIRSHLAEFGIVSGVGRNGARRGISRTRCSGCLIEILPARSV